MDNAEKDVSFFSTQGQSHNKTFNLSLTPPLKQEKIWLFCTQGNSGKVKVLVPAEVTYSINQSIKYNFEKPVPRQGASGCPLLNSKGEVVGVNVCLSSRNGVAVPVETILQQIN